MHAELGQDLEADFDFCLVAGQMEAQGKKKMRREKGMSVPLSTEARV